MKRIYKVMDLASLICSIKLKCSTTGPCVTVISMASVRRPPNRPRREDRICLQPWGQSILTGSLCETEIVILTIEVCWNCL